MKLSYAKLINLKIKRNKLLSSGRPNQEMIWLV